MPAPADPFATAQTGGSGQPMGDDPYAADADTGFNLPLPGVLGDAPLIDSVPPMDDVQPQDPFGALPPLDPAPIGGGPMSFLGIQIPSGDELYNQLMAGIEPELTTDQLPLLSERYKGETTDESKTRARRYEKAFKEYDKQLKQYLDDLGRKLQAHQRIAMSSAELGARAEEEDALSAIEASIQKS